MRNNKGFTLVEMAVVLVIIGIILGAVIKGNDLIENAKVKQVTQIPAKWETPIWTYYDRVGSFPASSSGLITGNIVNVADSLAGASIAYPSSLLAGIQVEIQSGAYCNSGNRNYMLLKSVPLDTAKSMDQAIDGTIDGQKGRVRSCTTTTSTAWVSTTDPVDVYYFFDKQP